eukprot:TRINITY_DN5244_c0_g1_i2.p1 TRINITY_DN5244_c0_g1~~TRINITY_DN5244_c0_g1_i2.p1  ORF type:complete len:199 (+),score=14.17 TRINITY_DN5244_c0_g1_i2:80-676(+)
MGTSGSRQVIVVSYTRVASSGCWSRPVPLLNVYQRLAPQLEQQGVSQQRFQATLEKINDLDERFRPSHFFLVKLFFFFFLLLALPLVIAFALERLARNPLISAGFEPKDLYFAACIFVVSTWLDLALVACLKLLKWRRQVKSFLDSENILYYNALGVSVHSVSQYDGRPVTNEGLHFIIDTDAYDFNTPLLPTKRFLL